MTKIYRVPFADGGTKSAIPISADPNSRVSDTEGFTGRYELPNTDPNYLPIERGEFNGILNDVTTALGEVQQFGFAKWQAGTWPQGARCLEGGIVYRSLTATSNKPPHASWVEDSPNIAQILQPTMTGSITTNGSTNNTLTLTAIVSTLGLEVGDVIRVNYSGYNKLHTVESITNDNSIIVNYEHASNRGNGPLKLANTTVSATITRIAKWYNAPLGLGQMWVSLGSFRVKDTDYINSTNRLISCSVPLSKTGGNNSASIGVFLNGKKIANSWVATNAVNNVEFLVPGQGVYSVKNNLDVPDSSWSELR